MNKRRGTVRITNYCQLAPALYNELPDKWAIAL